MDALAAEIARKRKASVDAKAALGSGGARKWVKKGELEQLRVAQYHESEAHAAEERSKKLLVPQFRESGVAAADSAQAGPASTSAADGSGAQDDGGASSSSAVPPVPTKSSDDQLLRSRPAEVKRRLRGLGQPIQLFGEEDGERLERYLAVSAALPNESVVNDALKAGQMFDETQLFDEAGNAKVDAAAVGGMGAKAAEEEDDEAEFAPSFVATTPEQVVSLHFKQLLKMCEAELEAARPEA